MTAFVIALSLTACGAGASFTPRYADQHLPPPKADYEKILVTKLDLKRPYEVLGVIEASGQAFASYTTVIEEMAKEARQVGADAIIKVHYYRWYPRGDRTAISHPAAKGLAVRFKKEFVAQERSKEVKSSILEVEIDEAPIREVTCKDGYAVVIGIEKYRDLPQVEFAQRDAQLLREYLIKTMGFPEANIVTLLNERALRSDLGKYFETWLRNNVDRDSTVFIYYSGHGAPGPKDNKAYLVPYDGDPNYPEKTCYPLDSLYASLDKLPAKEIIVAIDSCFSGAGGRSVVAEGARPLVHISIQNPMLASGNTVVLTAAAENEIASFYREAKHGLFTYFFLRGLRGDGDLDGDGWVELKELFDYLKPEVTGIARRMNREQTPVILPSPEILGKRGEYRLTKAK